MSAPTNPPWYDAHNHLQDAWLRPHRPQVFAALGQLPLQCAVVNGTDENDWREVATLAGQHAFIRPSFGLHPWNVGNATPRWQDTLREHLDAADPPSGRPVGVGEIGLDRWILERARPDDPRLAGLRRAGLEEQTAAFTWQLTLAAERNLPVTIHCLEAWGALLTALQTNPKPACGFLLHAYGGSAEMARAFAALGAYFSFNGYFLGDRQQARREVFALLPADRLLVETDAPAMPLPRERQTHALAGLADGKPINHPGNIGAVYTGLAEIRQVPLPELAEVVAANFKRLFGGGKKQTSPATRTI